MFNFHFHKVSLLYNFTVLPFLAFITIHKLLRTLSCKYLYQIPTILSFLSRLKYTHCSLLPFGRTRWRKKPDWQAWERSSFLVNVDQPDLCPTTNLVTCLFLLVHVLVACFWGVLISESFQLSSITFSY